MMFKLLFLKKLYDLSDEALISSAQTDMAYKFFLDLEPEAKMIDPSLLTKFRKTRITEDILEEMLDVYKRQRHTFATRLLLQQITTKRS